MSAKNRDNKNRWRNITVGFRVSPEEDQYLYQDCQIWCIVTAVH